jgi:hypothetical protein
MRLQQERARPHLIKNLAENDAAPFAQGCRNYTTLSEHGRRAAQRAFLTEARETTLEFVRVVHAVRGNTLIEYRLPDHPIDFSVMWRMS